MQLYTIEQTAEILGKPVSGVRHLIFYGETNGFGRCVVRIGRSVRIRADRLAQFIDENTGADPFPMSEGWRERNRKAARRRSEAR